MKHKVKNVLRALSRHLGLKVKFVDYLGDQTHGKLLVRERRILINARKPRSEHVFTVLHEIGHYLLHVLNPHRRQIPRFFDIHWQNDLLAGFFSKIRRVLRFVLNRQSGKEWEADLWALCAFCVLARNFSGKDELKNFLERHPEKLPSFLLVRCAFAYRDVKTLAKRIFQLTGPSPTRLA
jgi:hypothetical protein